MWGVDVKRSPGHSLRRVMLRFAASPDRHIRELRRLRLLAREDADGRSWRSCSTAELAPGDVHAVSLALDAAMFLPGPGVHVIVQPAPAMLLSSTLEALAADGLAPHSIQVVQQLTRAVDLVHSCNLVMLASLNEQGTLLHASTPPPRYATPPRRKMHGRSDREGRSGQMGGESECEPGFVLMHARCLVPLVRRRPDVRCDM